MKLITKAITYKVLLTQRELEIIKEGLILLDRQLDIENYDCNILDEQIHQLLLQDINTSLEIKEEH